MKDIVILDGARTPMAEYNGQFTEISAIDLGVIAAKETLRRSGVAPIGFPTRQSFARKRARRSGTSCRSSSLGSS